MRDKGKKEKTVKKHEIDMVNGPILKKMLVFALPLMLSSIMQMLFNATDIVVLGQFVGDHSLAAVGSTSSLINLLSPEAEMETGAVSKSPSPTDRCLNSLLP